MQAKFFQPNEYSHFNLQTTALLIIQQKKDYAIKNLNSIIFGNFYEASSNSYVNDEKTLKVLEGPKAVNQILVKD